MAGFAGASEPEGRVGVPAPPYKFYLDSYGGSLGASEYAAQLPAAVRHVRWVAGDPDLARASSDVVECFCRAVCAAVDAFAEWSEDRRGSVSLGDYKVSRYLEDRDTTASEEATAAACRELYGTGTLFCGVS